MLCACVCAVCMKVVFGISRERVVFAEHFAVQQMLCAANAKASAHGSALEERTERFA